MPAPNATLEPAQAAGALAWLAQAFWAPDQAVCADLIASAGALAGLAPALDADGAAAAGDLAAWLTARSDAQAFCAELAISHAGLFLARPGAVAISLHHSAHQAGGLLMGPAAFEMAQRLERAGLAIEAAGEPPDHLAVELGYLAHLLAQPGQTAAARAFAGGFALPWVIELAGKLAGEPGCPFYPLAAAVAAALLQLIAGQAGDATETTET